MILYYILIILFLTLLYLIHKYNQIKINNIKSVLSLDDNNILTFSIPIKSKYIEPRPIYIFAYDIKYTDLMTGDYYGPGFKPIKCETNEEFEHYKNKFDTCDKVWKWEKEEFEKYKDAIDDYLKNK